MSGRLELWLFVAQRASAMVLAPLVLIHLGTMIYAVQGGLTAAEILGRTQGSGLWATIYGLFVAAAAVHAAIGLRTVLAEMAPAIGALKDLFAAALFLIVVWFGFNAVGALV